MSNFEDLIKKHCPDGVEYVPIGSLMERVKEKGKDDLNVKQVYVVSNTRGIVRSEDYHDNSIHSDDTSNYTILKQDMFAYNPSRLNVGSIGRLKSTISGLVSPMYVVFSVDKSVVDVKYFEYFIKSPKIINKIDSLKEEGARFRFDYNRWNWINIPLPPIEVQKEIVRILDIFTKYLDLLNRELELRKKQYEYYRDKLLTFGEGVEYIAVGSLMERVREKGKDDLNVKQVYVVSNTRGIVRSEDYHDNSIHSDDTSNYTILKQDMFAYNPSRLNVGSIGRLKSTISGLVSPMYVVFSVDKSVVDVKYFEYFIKSPKIINKIDSLKEEGARFRFDYNRWNWIDIPVPPLEEQERIVNILDKFDALCNDITRGLPAEIELRKKQYEYYRDKLLTFKEKKC